MIFNKYLTVLVLLPMTLSGSTNKKIFEVPGNLLKTLQFGTGYDEDKAEPKNIGCVSGILDDANEKSGILQYAYEQDKKSIRDLLSGSIKGGYNTPITKVNGSASYVSNNSSTNFRESHLIHLNIKRSKSLNETSLQISDKGKEVIAKGGKYLIPTCGKSYVTEIKYGAQFFASLTIEYKNSKEKEKLKGSLSVDMLGDQIKVSGKLTKLDKKTASSIKVKIDVLQRGGNPEELATLLNGKTLSCTAKNLQACVNIFAETLNYGRSIKNQLKTESDYKIIKYVLANYEDGGFHELVPDNPPSVENSVKRIRDIVENRLTKNYNYEKRGDSVKKLFGWMSPSEISLFNQEMKSISTNISALERVLLYCYAHPYALNEKGTVKIPCIDNYNSELKNIKKINIDAFEVANNIESACILPIDQDEKLTISEIIKSLGIVEGDCRALFKRSTFVNKLSINNAIDLGPLMFFPNLKTLNIQSPKLYDISPIGQLTNLKELALSDIYKAGRKFILSDIHPLKNLTNLTSLYLGNNEISDISPLEGLVNLEVLELWGNNIQQVSALSELSKVSSLDLSKNEISDISSLTNLENISRFNMEFNPLGNIVQKSKQNCPTNASSEIVANWCAGI